MNTRQELGPAPQQREQNMEEQLITWVLSYSWTRHWPSRKRRKIIQLTNLSCWLHRRETDSCYFWKFSSLTLHQWVFSCCSLVVSSYTQTLHKPMLPIFGMIWEKSSILWNREKKKSVYRQCFPHPKAPFSPGILRAVNTAMVTGS